MNAKQSQRSARANRDRVTARRRRDETRNRVVRRPEVTRDHSAIGDATGLRSNGSRTATGEFHGHKQNLDGIDLKAGS